MEVCPSKEDIQLIDVDQIVKCDIDGECVMTADLRKRFFNLSNAKTISCAYKEQISWFDNNICFD